MLLGEYDIIMDRESGRIIYEGICYPFITRQLLDREYSDDEIFHIMEEEIEEFKNKKDLSYYA